MIAMTKQPEKIIGGGALVVAAGKISPMSGNLHSRRRGSFGRPSWLLFNIADMDERMKMLMLNASEESNADSFADRAEGYYQRRPQLMALLQDLYNAYVSLGDRYCQALAKNQHRRRYSSPISPFHFNENDQCDDEECGEVVDSDVESSLSYQTQNHPMQVGLDVDMLVADLVMKSVNYEIVVNELNVAERRWGDSSRKIELQKSLLDVLESERLILLNENAGLGFRVNSLLEENKGLASESLFLKRKAAELARCMMKMREDHRVCILSRKIEDLQGQICRLEKRNKEYYDQLVQHEEEKKNKGRVVKGNTGAGVILDDCFHVPEDAVSRPGNSSRNGAGMKKAWQHSGGTEGGRTRALKLWDRVKAFDIFRCMPHSHSTYC